MEKEKNITKFIDNRRWVCNLMRSDFINGKELMHQGITSFATTFISLQNLYNLKGAMKQMFVSDKWTSSKYAHEINGMNIVDWFFDDAFWKAMHYII